MSADLNAADAAPSATDYSAAWVAYTLQATGAFGFVPGPLIALVVSYVRRDAADVGYVASHHRWLIRTFWWSLAWYLLCVAVIIGGAWPIISEIIGEAIRSGGRAEEFSFGLAWGSIFATVSAAMLGGLGLVVVWIWNLYRLLRGGFVLADRRPMP